MTRFRRHTTPGGDSIHLSGNLSRGWPPFKSKQRVLADERLCWTYRESPLTSLPRLVIFGTLGGGAVVLAVNHTLTGSDILDLAIYVVLIVLIIALPVTKKHLEFNPSTSEIVIRRGLLFKRATHARLRDVELGVHPVELVPPRNGLVVDWTWYGHALILWLPEDERFVFACLRGADQVVDYASALPEPFRAMLAPSGSLSPQVRAGYAGLL